MHKKDSAHSWLVLLAAFTAQLIMMGMFLCFGIYVVTLTEYFNATRSQVALVGSITFATKCLTALTSSACCRLFGCRIVVMIGGVIASLGCVLSYFSQTLAHLYLCFGLTTGFGIGLAYTPSLAILAQYFDKWKYFATAFATVGSACGSFLFQPLFFIFIQKYGWRGSMLINAGFALQITVCGALMKSQTDPASSSTLKRSLLTVLFEPTLLFHSSNMLLIGINCACWGGAVYTGFSLLNALVIDDVGLTKKQSAMLASAVGLSNVVGRLVASVVGHHQSIDRLTYYACATLGISAGLALAAASTSMIPASIGLCLFGFSFGSMLSQLAGVLIQLFGAGRLVNALGYAMFSVGIGNFTTVIFGIIADKWSVSTAYYSASLITVVSGLVAFFVAYKHRHACHQNSEKMRPLNSNGLLSGANLTSEDFPEGTLSAEDLTTLMQLQNSKTLTSRTEDFVTARSHF